MNKLIIFTLGVVTGTTISSYYLKNKYEDILKTEIESVKKVFSRKNVPNEEYIDKQTDDEVYSEYEQTITNNDYTASEDVVESKIYVIKPDEFGEIDDFDKISLGYFQDGILTDYDSEDIIEDVENVCGQYALTTFGEYEDDCVYVRNEILKVDYEILLMTATYEKYMSNRGI
ncbi:MAG: hypothetical protein R3Y12_04240 [Clostridia bacterium]